MIDYVYNVELWAGCRMANMSQKTFWNEADYWDKWGGPGDFSFWRPLIKIRILAVVKPEGWV